jgi:DNA polymerase-3 subunit delta'
VSTTATPLPTAIVGHGWVLEFLARTLAGGSAPHAYLLVGAPHVGKFTTALAMAQLLLCAEGTRCGVCRHCQLVARRVHPDLRVLEIPADKKSIPLGEVHELLRGIALRPLEAERRVCIVRGAENLAEEGANALLKTLEEPPPSVTMILTAPETGSVLPTIVSRCQTTRLRPAPIEEIAAHLVARFAMDPARADEIARASRGRPGWAVSAAENAELLGEREGRARELLAMLSGGRLERIAGADHLAERWSGHADEVTEALEAWMELWRDVLLSQHGAADRIGYVGLRDAVRDLATALRPEAVRQALAATIATADALQRNAHPRLALETYALHLPRRAINPSPIEGRDNLGADS